MTDTRNGDQNTVLRHLVANTNWSGNQGERAETEAALDRLFANNYGDDDAESDSGDAGEPAIFDQQ